MRAPCACALAIPCRSKRLILGFNTFLPEGHKINNEDIERSENEFRAAENEKNEIRAAEEELKQRQMQQGASSGQGGGHGAGDGNGAGGGFGGGTTGGGTTGGGAPGQGAGMQPPAHQEFDHAISYVTNIKQRFAKEPETYKSFLEILHAYQQDQKRPKEQQKGIHEVLDKVSKLFADHPDLLEEFTYFLPDAVQHEAKECLGRAARESEARKARMMASGRGGAKDEQHLQPCRVPLPRATTVSGGVSACAAWGNLADAAAPGSSGGLDEPLVSNKAVSVFAVNLNRYRGGTLRWPPARSTVVGHGLKV